MNEIASDIRKTRRKYFLIFLYIIVSIHFLLNFIGSPALKYFYLLELGFIFLSVFLLRFRLSVMPMLYLLFIEGQGRILWEYHPFFRNIFDFIVITAILKSFAIKKKLITVGKIPRSILFLIFLHFAWYLLQLFNVYNVGFLGTLAASKIYIYPFFLFLLFLENPINHDEDLTESIQKFFIFLLTLEAVLCMVQMEFKEPLLMALSPYYKVAMKDVFVDTLFRPFGTTHLSGAYSVYFAFGTCFLFLSRSKSNVRSFFILLSVSFNWIALYLMQVRSALAKHVIILLAINIILLLVNKFRFKNFIKYLFFFAIFFSVAINFIDMEKLFPDTDLTEATSRILIFTDLDEAKSAREGPDVIFGSIFTKLSENPLGLGPGRTGAASSVGLANIQSDPVYNMQDSWAWDNLWVSLAIDLGVGMIFYTIITLYFPLVLAFRTIKHFNTTDSFHYRGVVLSAVTTIIILVGNYGAIGLPYNPESFLFWFWAAFGMNSVYELKIHENEIQISKEEAEELN